MKLYFESSRSLKARKLEPFFLERHFAKHEFSAKNLLPSSDCEAFYMEELLESANAPSLGLWESLKLGILQGHRAQRACQREAGVSYTAMHVVPFLPTAFCEPVSTLTVSKTCNQDVPNIPDFEANGWKQQHGDRNLITLPKRRALIRMATCIP